jgi:hypothetical protein
VPGWLDRRLPHLDFEGNEPELTVPDDSDNSDDRERVRVATAA